MASSSVEVRDLKKNLTALSSLQNDYIKLVEEEDADCGEAIAYYSQLIDELKKNVKKESLKYARLIVTNPHFSNALEIENGNTIWKTITLKLLKGPPFYTIVISICRWLEISLVPEINSDFFSSSHIRT